jgi:endo-beta-N-acetylglucosaminidase D
MNFGAESIVLAVTFLFIGLTLGVLICSVKTEQRISAVKRSALDDAAKEKARITAELDEQLSMIKKGMSQITSAYERASEILEWERTVSEPRAQLNAPVRLAITSGADVKVHSNDSQNTVAQLEATS